MAENKITVTSVEETNSRYIATFLARVPRNTEELVLRTDEEPTIRVNVWEERDAMVPALKHDVETLAQGYADEQGAIARLVLEFVAADGRSLKAMRILRSPRNVGSMSVYDPKAGELDGSARAHAAQLQRHTETSMRMMVEVCRSALEHSTRLTEQAASVSQMLAQRLAESDTRERKTREEAEEMRLAVQQAESEVPEQRAEGLDKLANMLEPVLPLLLAKMTSTG